MRLIGFTTKLSVLNPNYTTSSKPRLGICNFSRTFSPLLTMLLRILANGLQIVSGSTDSKTKNSKRYREELNVLFSLTTHSPQKALDGIIKRRDMKYEKP